ncbi:unnamed protein product [Rotaria sp. Silwood1]|nr:unnamed protein product [Rotaria sp. Silwood1]
MLTEQSPNSSSGEHLLTENESISADIPRTDNNNRRRTSRSSLKNSDTWARKRALLHRGYQWTTTLDREPSINNNNNQITECHLPNNVKSLPNSINKSSPHTNQEDNLSSSEIPMLTDSNSNNTSYNLFHRRQSSRRLPDLPAISTTNKNSSNNDVIRADLTLTSSSHSSTECPYQPLRENSLSNYPNRSKSIDSESSLKSRSSHIKLLHAHQTQNAKSIDISNLARQKSFLIVNNTLLPQRSLDYPCIVRKAQDLSDIVRTRMLYSKMNKQQQGNHFSISLEREHVPKVPRKIIIRQDNSIEIALSQPPKLRRNTVSEDYYYGYNPEADFGISQTAGTTSTLGLPLSASMSGSVSGDRRKTIETCENIYLHAEESSKLRARTPPSNPHRILLHRDKNDTSIRTNGLGMRIVGGQECEDGSLGCFVTNILSGGPAHVQGNIEVGDQILEFNGNSLIDSTYEEVRMLQDQCGDIVQLVVQHNNIRLQINDKLPFISPRAISLIEELHENLQMLPEEQDQQRKKCTQLLDDIIESLTDNLFVAENSIHEKQIDVLLNQTKLHLKKIKEKFLTSSLNIESFNALFKELTECIEGVYNIMSQIFKYVSSNINKLTTKIQTLSTQMDNIKTTNTKLLTDIEAMQKKQKEFQKRIEQLEQQELKRIKKEKYRERQVLIRDLFSIPKDWLCEELIHNNLPDTDVKIYSKRETDSKKLLSEYPLLYSILQKVSKEFEIDPVHMLNYLKEKKDPNKSFHVNADLKKYVYEHTNYDLKQFLETKEMYPLDEQDYTCYRCTGHVIEWTKSFYSTTTRTRKMLDIPDAIKTEYDALQIFKYKKHDRVLARVIEKQVTITKALDVSRVIQEPTYYQNLPLSNYVVSSTGRLSSSLAIMQKEVERLGGTFS